MAMPLTRPLFNSITLCPLRIYSLLSKHLHPLYTESSDRYEPGSLLAPGKAPEIMYHNKSPAVYNTSMLAATTTTTCGGTGTACMRNGNVSLIRHSWRYMRLCHQQRAMPYTKWEGEAERRQRFAKN